MFKGLFKMFTKEDRVSFITISYAQFLQGVFMVVIGSLLPFLREAYDLNYRVSGLLMSFLSAGQVIGALIAAFVTLKLGFKKSFILFSFLIVAGMILVLFGGHPVFLILIFMVMGIGRSAVVSFNNDQANVLPGDNSVNLNMMHALFALGALVAPLIVMIFTNMWQGTNVAVAVIGAVSLVMIAKTPFADDKASKTEETKKSLDTGFLKSKIFWLCTLIVAMYVGVEAGVIGWIATFFLESGLIEEQYAQLLTSLLWASFLVGRVGCAFVSKNMKSDKLVLWLSILTLVSMVILFACKNLVLMLIGALGTGLGLSGVYASALSGANEIMNKYKFAMSTFMFVTSVAAIVVPYLIGEVAERVSTDAGMWILVVFTAVQVVISGINIVYRRKNKIA